MYDINERTRVMKGFDPKWADFPDYILGITREIWEGRGIATLDLSLIHI